jgi:hypothetical protein
MSLLRTLTDCLPPPDPRPLGQIDDDILDELQSHIEMRTQDNLAAGMTADAARQDALRRFGDFERTRRECRRVRVGERIMLQRLQAVLTVVLVGAVAYLAVAHYRGQCANEAALAKMSQALESIAGSAAGPSAAEAELKAMLASTAPVVVETSPKTGAIDVDPTLPEIRVIFSKAMLDQSWSWSQTSDETFPETTGEPHYLADGKTCVLPVKLQPGKTYEIWLNSEKFRNFKDRHGNPSAPHFLRFQTKK